MTARLLAFGLLVVVVLTVALSSRAGREPPVVSAIRHEFGTGWLAGCFVGIAYRETGGTYDVRSVNWADRHADGSRGSFGALQIGALWRRPGETVMAFAARMFDPAQNARLAHRIYDRYGLQPWGGNCS